MNLSLRCPAQRSGGIALPTLIALPALLMALITALSGQIFCDIRFRLQDEADASALAGADALPGDALLRGRYQSGANSSELFDLLLTARSQIQSYAMLNPVYGGYSTPDWNPAAPTQGDIIFGYYDRTQSTPFMPVVIADGMGEPNGNLQTINSVNVTMRRTEATNNAIKVPSMPLIGRGAVDTITGSTAMLDGDLQGFRPMFPDRPVPLVPFALDYTAVMTQTSRPYTDQLAYVPASQSFEAGGDNLPEITVNVTTSGDAGVATTAVELNIGVGQAADVQAQIINGIQPGQLSGAPFGGAFLLQPNSATMQLMLTVPGQQYIQASDGNTLAAGFQAIAQPPYTGRIWPLYNGFDSSGNPVIVGFIAARLANVQPSYDMMSNVQALTLTLQPTLITAPSAVTNPLYRGYSGVPNLTIAKLRLVP